MKKSEAEARGLKIIGVSADQTPPMPESLADDGPSVGVGPGSSMTLGADSHENSLGRLGRQWVARGMGAADSLSMGFADELSGAMTAGAKAVQHPAQSLADPSSIKNDYIDGRDKYRDTSAGVQKWSSADDPLVGPYAQGQVAGMVPAMMAPGGQAKAAGSAVSIGSRALSALKGLGADAGFGALFGVGSSEKDTPEGVMHDARNSALLGAGLGTVIRGGAAGIRGGANLANSIKNRLLPEAEEGAMRMLPNREYVPSKGDPVVEMPPVEAPAPRMERPAPPVEAAPPAPQKPPPPVPDKISAPVLAPIPRRRVAPKVETPSTAAKTGAERPKAKQEELIAALKEKVNGAPRDSMKTGEIQAPPP